MSQKVKVTLYLTPEAKRMLEEMAAKVGLNNSTQVEAFIRQAATKEGKK